MYSAPYNIWHLINRLSIHVNVLYFYDRQIRFLLSHAVSKKTSDDNNKKHTRNLSHGSRSVMAQKTTWTIDRDYYSRKSTIEWEQQQRKQQQQQQSVNSINTKQRHRVAKGGHVSSFLLLFPILKSRRKNDHFHNYLIYENNLTWTKKIAFNLSSLTENWKYRRLLSNVQIEHFSLPLHFKRIAQHTPHWILSISLDSIGKHFHV